MEPISFDTINFKLRNLKQFITWSFDRKYLADDVGKIVTLKKTIDQRRTTEDEEKDPFDRDDIEAIVKGLAIERPYKHKRRTLKGRPAHYWLPLLALFSGCRAEELAQLLASDIRESNGVWCIWIDYYDDTGGVTKSLKTANAKRLIPLHRTFIELGFLEYSDRVKSRGELRLWPELKGGARNKYHRAVTDWFNGTSRKGGIKKRYLNPETSKKKSFHSTRHSFSTGLENALVEEIIASRLMGHKKNKSITYGRYSKGLSLGILAEGINKLDYEVDFVGILGTDGADDLSAT